MLTWNLSLVRQHHNWPK